MSKCPINQYSKRYATITKNCCANGNCRGGFPVNCTLECSQHFPKFFDDCSTLLKTQEAVNFASFETLATTCRNIPTDKMLVAISTAKCIHVKPAPPQGNRGPPFLKPLDTVCSFDHLAHVIAEARLALSAC